MGSDERSVGPRRSRSRLSLGVNLLGSVVRKKSLRTSTNLAGSSACGKWPTPGSTSNRLLGIASSAAGYGAGLLVAWWIGRQIFPESAAAGVGVNYGVFLPVTGVTLAMAAAATLAAAARIWRIRPAVILRGE